MAQFTPINLSNEDMVRYILNLIRYDIPILMAGKSSIGKSFTMLSLAENWHLPNAVLYVGSEKADNIEGLPKLIDDQSVQKENVLTYFKPYWYPQSQKIQDSVSRGRIVFDQKILPNFSNPNDYNLPYNTIMGLLFSIRTMKFPENSSIGEFEFVDKSGYVTPSETTICKGKITLTRQIPDKIDTPKLDLINELADLSLFLCTLVGLGNYWLILDELDKVQPEEADKFAPMLHIVRERRLKTYNMREFNDGEGANVAKNVVEGSYRPIYEKIVNSLDNNKSVLDTRIIAISNKTNNIIDISDALFKRFVQVIVNNVLVLDKVEQQLSEIRNCLQKIETKIGGTQGDLTVGKLEEINLQWQFGFLPKILNNKDVEGNFIRNNFLNSIINGNPKLLAIENPQERNEEIIAYMKKLANQNDATCLFKLCMDNFEEIKPKGEDLIIPDLVFDCLQGQMLQVPTKDEKVSPIDIINEFKKKGLDDKQISTKIYDLLVEKLGRVSNDDRYGSIERLIVEAFDYIKFTAYSDGYDDSKIQAEVEYSPLEINKYLIPVIIRFILKAITKDESLSFDKKDNLMQLHAKLWSNFTIPEHIEKLQGDPELTKELFYEGEDSLWGSAELDADDFQNSFVNKFTTANFPLFYDFVLDYLEITNVDEKQNLKDFVEYIKKYRKDDLEKVKKAKLGLLAPKEQVGFIKKFKSSFGI